MIEPISDSEYLFRVAAEAANEGEHKKALDYLEQVLTTNPNHAKAWCIKGNCLDCLGQYEEAVRSYNTALKLDPNNADTWFDKGLTLKKLGREKESQSAEDIAVKLALGE
ncbi:MAG: tetratricopeptide repeat protein [Methanomicrobiales archaeon]|nr:tetratricopeptide repeat protein [Methanomicrobiales archaeon]